MNIFYVDESPEIAGQSLCDKHIVKMSLESAQMIANCFEKTVLVASNTPKTQKGTPRQYSHWNHPSSIWVRQSKAHMRWLLRHAIAICQEKKRRYPDKPLPFVYDFLKWAQININKSDIPNLLFVPPPQCMPDHCKVDGNTVESYRNYYRMEKRNIATWKNSRPPLWFVIDKPPFFANILL